MKRKQVVPTALLALAALALAGCISPGTTVVSPEVRGRVVDATSRQPIAGALVQMRVDERSSVRVHTASSGDFKLPHTADFHLIAIPGTCGWGYLPMGRIYTDEMTVAHPAYRRLEIGARKLSATPLPDYEPASVKTVDILLHRDAR